MKVLLWNTSYLQGLGGTETHTHLLLDEFARRGMIAGLFADRPLVPPDPRLRRPSAPCSDGRT